MEEVFQIIPKHELYQRTGTQFLHFNTLYQLYSLKRQRPDLLQRADCLLLMPDLFLYLLTGRRQAEFTIASTGQMVNPYTTNWDEELLDRLDLPRQLLCPIVHPGQPAAPLAAGICAELGLEPIPVMVAASHDTASAVVAVPATEDDFIYISSGTWSLMGIESPRPLINDQTFSFNFTNEGGYNKTTRFLKNIMGLWLIQESRRQWMREGATVSYADLEKEALSCTPFASLIDPDEEELGFPGDMPARIRQLCEKTGQPVPQTRGEVVRCIYESLALKYQVTKEQIEQVTGKKYPYLHVVGGGTKDGLLSQFTANATGSRVIAGPIEATALGNMAVQLLAHGAILDLAAARKVVANSFELKFYEPADQAIWQEARQRYRQLYPVLK
jgi:sugar (pentulose or hexulose) kinase